MSRLEKVIYEINSIERGAQSASLLHRLDARAKLLVTILFLVVMLSISLSDLPQLILFSIYPIITASMSGIGYGTIFKRSLVILPFVGFIGIFNPLIDRHIVFYIGKIGITAGWISFISIILRGLLSVQAVFLLIYTTGFYHVCRGMQHLGIPAFFTIQLIFVYRYMFVLLQEALNMHRARTARSFGKKSYSFRMWGIFVGQLLIRTVERSQRIYQAMLSRGFTGNLRGNFPATWKMRETYYLMVWSLLFILLRFFHFPMFLNEFSPS